MKKLLIWLLTTLYPSICVFEKTAKNSMYEDEKGNLWQCFCRRRKKQGGDLR